MKLKSFLVILPFLTAIATLGAGQAKAGSKAHEHGTAILNFVVEGASLTIEFLSPAVSIYGFEYEAKSEADKQNQRLGLSRLKEKFGEIVVLDRAFNCQLKDSKVEIQKDKSEHSEVKGAFRFECTKPLAGSAAQVDFSKHFNSVKLITVQILSGEKQTGTKIKQKGWVEL